MVKQTRFNSFKKRLDADVELKSRYKIFIDGNWAYGGDSSERDTKQKLLPAPPLLIQRRINYYKISCCFR